MYTCVRSSGATHFSYREDTSRQVLGTPMGRTVLCPRPCVQMLGHKRA